MNRLGVAVTLFLVFISVAAVVHAAPEKPKATPAQSGANAVNNIPENIKLAAAKNFADSVKGENGAWHESYALYSKVRDEALGLDVKQLEWLRANGGPAGKLYGAILLYESSKLGLEDAFKPLLKDETEVTYFSGCKGSTGSVASMAEKFVSERRYHNFSLSLQCKHLQKSD